MDIKKILFGVLSAILIIVVFRNVINYLFPTTTTTTTTKVVATNPNVRHVYYPDYHPNVNVSANPYKAQYYN